VVCDVLRQLPGEPIVVMMTVVPVVPAPPRPRRRRSILQPVLAGVGLSLIVSWLLSLFTVNPEALFAATAITLVLGMFAAAKIIDILHARHRHRLRQPTTNACPPGDIPQPRGTDHAGGS
jgi:hypothetical protein